MSALQALQRCDEILTSAGVDTKRYTPANSGEFFNVVIDVMKFQWTQPQRQRAVDEGWLGPFLNTLAQMQGEWDQLVASDPMMLYRPQHQVSLAFHRSNAFVKFFRAGNRCSKTQSGYAEHYYVLTNQHPYRYIPRDSHSTCIVGTQFQKYYPNVFAKKILFGEDDNSLSPMFPEGGKFFNNYDARHHILTVACPECAAAGRPQQCPPYHKGRGELSLYSNEAGDKSIMGAQFRVLHLDEHCTEGFYNEGLERIQSVSHSCMLITGTPLDGSMAWEQTIVADRAQGPRELNIIGPGTPFERPYAELFQIDQFAAGIVPHHIIHAKMADMMDYEKKARVYGIPAVIADRPVFDGATVDFWYAQAPKTKIIEGVLDFNPDARDDEDKPIDIRSCYFWDDIKFTKARGSRLQILEQPEEKATYIMGIDSAAGLHAGAKGRVPDASACSVFKVEPSESGYPRLKLVAQYHGWINPIAYAKEIKKLGIYYNMALAVIELTGGLGRSVMHALKDEYFYPMVFRDTRTAEAPEPGMSSKLGVDTNMSTKPQMVAAATYLFQAKLLELPHTPTLNEIVAFSETHTESGRTVRFEGGETAVGSGERAKDDRVISCVLAAYVAIHYPLFDYHATIEDSISVRMFRPDKEKRDNADNAHVTSGLTLW